MGLFLLTFLSGTRHCFHYKQCKFAATPSLCCLTIFSVHKLQDIEADKVIVNLLQDITVTLETKITIIIHWF